MHRCPSVSNAWLAYPSIWITFYIYCFRLVDISHRLLCTNCVEIWSFELFIFRYFDIGWFYANECSPQIFLIGWPIMPPWFLGPGHSVDSVLAMCAHPLGDHMHFMPKSIYFFNPALLRIMPICGFHWHSRYSIWISIFVLLHCVWFPGSSCGHKLLTLIICHNNW